MRSIPLSDPSPRTPPLNLALFRRTKPLDELFNMSRFLEGLDPTARPFLQRLTSTQMFWVTVQQWIGRPSSLPSSSSSAPLPSMSPPPPSSVAAAAAADSSRRLLFFEECAIAIKNRRAGAVVPWRDDSGEAGVGEGSASGRGGEGW